MPVMALGKTKLATPLLGSILITFDSSTGIALGYMIFKKGG